MDTVDDIIFKFEINMEDVHLHNLKAPWIKLQRLSNETDDLSALFDEYFEAVDAVDNFNDFASEELLARAENLQAKSKKLNGNSDKKMQKSDKMKGDVENFLMDIRDITGVVQETIINLENYGRNDHHIKLPIALKEAQMYLNDIKYRSKNIPKAHETLKCANEHHEFWTEELLTTTQQREKIESFVKLRNTFNSRLEDLKNLTRRTFRDSLETEAFVTKNRKDFEKLKDKANRINDDNEELQKLLTMEIIAQSDSLMESLHDGIAKLRLDNKDLIDLNAMIDATIAEREEELEDIKTRVVPEARKHANDLAQRSKYIVDHFQHSKDGARVAMLAGTAHKNISDAVEAARIAADEAYNAAMFSNKKLNPADPEEETMIEKGKDLTLESVSIQDDAEDQITKIKGKIAFLSR